MLSVGVPNNASVTLDGKTSFTLGGQTGQWFDNWFNALFIGPQGGATGFKFSLNFAGSLVQMGSIRFNGGSQMKVTVRDTTIKGDHFIDSLVLSHGGSDVSLKFMSMRVLSSGRGDDVVTLGAGSVGQLQLGEGNNKATTGAAFIESITAFAGNDEVTIGDGGAGAVSLNQGNNKVTTGKGWVDAIITRDGDDTATIGDGGAGSVSLGHGDNVVKTGKGWVDSIVTRGGEDKVTVGRGAAEFVSLGAGNDTLVLTTLSNTDNLVTANGGSGADTVDLSLLSRGVELDLRNGFFEGKDGKFLLLGFENVIGTAKSDELTGTDAINTIDGGKGSDKITGGKGADELTGGAGGDHFIYLDLTDSTASAKGRDLITDFSQVQKDRIDLSAIDAIRGGDDDDFTFIGTAAFSKTKGTIRFENDGDTTFVYADVNGDRKADFAIELDGGINLKVTDFIL